MKKPRYKISDYIFYYNKWNNQIEHGEIIGLRQANLNWDYNIRYQIYSDIYYVHWIEEKHLGKNKKILLKFLI